MKVGEAGESFFVFETEHEVPEEFQTSPIMGAEEAQTDQVSPKDRVKRFLLLNHSPCLLRN